MPCRHVSFLNIGKPRPPASSFLGNLPNLQKSTNKWQIGAGPNFSGPAPIFRGHAPPFQVMYEQIPYLVGVHLAKPLGRTIQHLFLRKVSMFSSPTQLLWDTVLSAIVVMASPSSLLRLSLCLSSRPLLTSAESASVWRIDPQVNPSPPPIRVSLRCGWACPWLSLLCIPFCVRLTLEARYKIWM